MKAGGSTSVELDDQPMDCSFHPWQKIVAAGLITGGIRLLDCSGATPRETASFSAHNDSCRSLHFAAEGARIISGSADHSVLVYDVASEKPVLRLTTAHDCAVERILPLSEHTFASGDEEGLLRLWDTRQKQHMMEFGGHTDFVTDIGVHESESCLLGVSGDGTLSVNDLRTRKVRARSEEDADNELSSVVVLKSGKKVVCGSQLGVLTIFTWGQFADCSDRLPGHPASVDCVLKLDEDTVITGSGDGVIRVLSVQPHALLGVLGEQQQEGGCERLALSHDRRLLASTSYGASLELWDTSCLDEDADNDEEAAEKPQESQVDSSDEEKQAKKRGKKQKKGSSAKKLKHSAASKSAGFFNDLL